MAEGQVRFDGHIGRGKAEDAAVGRISELGRPPAAWSPMQVGGCGLPAVIATMAEQIGSFPGVAWRDDRCHRIFGIPVSRIWYPRAEYT